MSDNFNSSYVDGIKQELAESAKAICDITKRNTCTIHVDEFKQKWLQPLLHSLDENVSRNWIHKVALTPYDKVNILDTNGSVVAVVPGFCVSTSDYIKPGFSLDSCVSAIKNATIIKRHDLAGKHYNTLIKNIKQNDIPLENFKAWIHIAEYFNENPAWLKGFKYLVENNNKVNNTTTPDTGKKDDDHTVFEPV